LLDALTPHTAGPLWSRAEDEAWIFRGQRDATWDLTPSAFRCAPNGNPAFTQFKDAQVTERPHETLKEMIDHEEKFALDFASNASLAGFEVPGDRPELRDPELAIDEHDGCDFPPISQRWIYALAQHYSVPTRFIDWTDRPLIAAYFAAEGAARRVKEQKAGADEHLAVWALSRGFVENVASKWNPGPVTVTVPTTSNPNLHAQRGLFSLVRYKRGGDVVPAIPPSLDSLFREQRRSDEWIEAHGGVPPSRGVMLFKLRLPVRESPFLLYFLARHGVDCSAVFPGLKSVADAMRETKLLSRRRPGETP
jgi:hypothetical protein